MNNLARGWPCPTLLPSLKSLLSLTEEELRTDTEEALQYGEDAGSNSMLDAIASLRKQTISTNQILITNGSSQGLSICCSRFCRPGDSILVETLSYFYAKYIFEQQELRVFRVPPNAERDGSTGGTPMDLISLERILEEMENTDQILPKLLYCVPVGHNPTGATMKEHHARELLRIARRFSFKIVSDEVYLFLTFDSISHHHPRSLLEYDNKDDSVVLSLNSFSKILGPGLRLGWIESSPNNIKFLEKTGFIASGGGLNPFASAIVSKFIRNGKQEAQIKLLCEAYQQRSTIMCDALARHLGAVQVTIEEVLKPVISEPSFVRVTGGFFLWLRFPNRWDIDTDSFLDYCKSRNPPVTFFPGSFFCFGKYLGTPDSNSRVICDAWCKHAIRLCFAYLPESHIETAVLQLATAVLNISQGTTVADIQTITSS